MSAEMPPLAFLELGAPDGAPLIMLHGWGADKSLVAPLGEKLAARGLRVLIPDLPGFGESPPPPVAWTIFDYAACAADFAAQQGITRAHWFGHSFGGRIGLILGADYPQLVHKLVLSDAAGLRPPVSPLIQARTHAYKFVRDGLNSIGLKSVSERLRAAYTARYASADYQAAAGTVRESFVRVVNQDLRPWADRVQAPTLLLWGSKDEDTPLSQGQELERRIPDAGLVVFEGAGHYSYLERAADAAHIMLTFFG